MKQNYLRYQIEGNIIYIRYLFLTKKISQFLFLWVEDILVLYHPPNFGKIPIVL